MRRREYLGLVGAGSLSFIAGCSSGDSSDQNGGEVPSDQDGGEDHSEQNGGGSEEASLEIVNTGYVLSNSVVSYQDNEIPWGFVDIENTSEVAHGFVETQTRFYNSQDTLQHSQRGYIDYIPAETTWRNYVRFYTETPEQVDYIEGRIVRDTPSVDASTVEGEVLQSDLKYGPETGINFTAEVGVGGTASNQIVVVGLFYDDAGLLRGSIRQVTSNPGETITVSSSTLARTPPSLADEQVTTAELLLFDGRVA